MLEINVSPSMLGTYYFALTSIEKQTRRSLYHAFLSLSNTYSSDIYRPFRPR